MKDDQPFIDQHVINAYRKDLHKNNLNVVEYRKYQQELN